MADQRTMTQLFQAPTEGYEDAIVVLAIIADNFEIKHGLFTLVQNKHEAWDRFKDLLRACPHHSFSELHQLDTFYNALNSKHQDSLNSATGGNFLDKMPRECLTIIESKSKVRYSRNKPVVAKVSTNTSTFGISPDVAELKDMVKVLLLDKKSQSPAPMKAVEESFVTCGGAHSYRNFPANDGNVYRDNIQEFVSQASTVNYNQGNTSYHPLMMSNQIRPPGFPPVPNNQNVQLNPRNNQNRFIPNQNRGNNFNQGPIYQPRVFQPPAYQALAYQASAPQTQGQNMQNQLTNLITKFVNSNSASTSSSCTLSSNIIANPRSDLKEITTQNGVSYDGPQIPPPTSFLPKVVENEPESTKDIVNPTNNGSTEDVQPQPNPTTSIPYPSRRNDERNPEKANNQIEKFYQIFKDMSFKISFADALILMPKFASTPKALIGNKEKFSEMARTPLNEHCFAVFLKKLPKKLGDPGKFLIPCDFPGMVECLALAFLGASIKLMPFSMWKKLSLPDLTPTCMTFELADHSISRPVGVAEDDYVKVGSFHFSTNFVVVDFDADPRVPLILGRSFLKTRRALIDVFEGELTLRVGKEAITFNLDQTSSYSANYSDMTAKRIDVIDMACEEYSQEVLGFSDTISSGNPTPYYDPIVSTTSLTLSETPYLDPEGDILLLEAFLNDDPSSPSPSQGNYLPEVRKELKIYEAKSDKSSVDEPLEGIDPEFYTHKILMKEEFKPAVQHQRRVNPKIHDVIKQEVIKLLEAGLIYPISDSPWVSSVHCVPKKGGFTVVENEDNELIPTRLVTGWRVCIDYQKLNEATRKDNFPLLFMDQMLERLVGNQYYCFFDGFSGNFQIFIVLKDLEKTTFTCPYGTFAYRHMPFGLCNAPGTFQRCMMAMFHDMIEKTMEVFMDDFFVFGNSFQSCLSHLERMLKSYEDTNLCQNWEKSHFMVKEGIVLDNKISKQWIKVDKAKLDVITKLPHPTTVKGIRSFLGHAGFYCRFIKDFSKRARLVTRLLKKDTPFIFSQECVVAFQTLKIKLTEAPILIAPDWNMPFELMCDASDYAIGAVLGQRQDKHFRPIHYASKTMIEAESKYTTTEKEMLAVVYGFEKFQSYLIMNKSIVYTDHSALKYFFAKKHSKTSGQVEVSNRGLQRILERAVGENHASWLDKLDYARWAFRTAYKTPIGCTPYKLLYEKACHLLVELQHKAY
uniref:Reverse transcriptase domain-containing protein n=1 Tax=Tanacetum cinerariifolium TaxID=118510 RepID=A0A699HEN5_TANCI|nr:reverse transcriptase domain-containing protein [Tanacetum cinerariifolium]